MLPLFLMRAGKKKVVCSQYTDLEGVPPICAYAHTTYTHAHVSV